MSSAVEGVGTAEGTELVSDEPLALDVGAVSEGGVGTGAVVGFGAALVVALELGVPGVVLEVVLEVVFARTVVRLDPVVVVVVPIRAIVPVVDVTGSRLPARVVDAAVVLVVELVATGTEVSASKSF